jgi:2-(1,2-epoxy-1,2-dihydrophenyl)acetyl-CoA isomerase
MNDRASVKVAISQGVAHVRLCRPDRLNVIDHQTARQLADFFGALTSDDSVRAAALTAEGKAFMAGGDLRLFRDQPHRRVELIEELVGDFHRAIRAIRALPVPVIAGVQGAVAGAGFSLALACDIVIAGDDAMFVPAYSKIGASPDGGLSWSLCRALGGRRAKEALMLGEPIDAQQALAMGLVNRVVASGTLQAAVTTLASELAHGPRHSLAAIKALVNLAEGGQFNSHLDFERESYIKMVATPDFGAGIEAFFARKPAKFG